MRPASLRGPLISVAVVSVLLVLLALMPTSTYFEGRITQGIILVGLALSWNVIGGYAGQLSLGQAAFFGIGAYVAAEVSGGTSLGTLPALAAGMGAAALMALLVIPCFRARGAYFAVLTLALAAIVLRVAERYAPGGNSGIFYDGFEVGSSQPYLLASLGVVATLALTVLIARSRLGRALAAVRLDQDAARSVGVRDVLARSQAVLISAAIAGYFGGLYALTLGFLDPNTAFSLDWSVIPLLAVVLGGIGTLLGPVIGGAIWFGLEELITNLGLTSDAALIVQGSILLGIALLAPRGIVGIAEALWSRFGPGRERPPSQPESDAPRPVEAVGR